MGTKKEVKNFQDINHELSKAIDILVNDENADVARLKEVNNKAKTIILNNSKLLAYNQFMKKANKIEYFEDK